MEASCVYSEVQAFNYKGREKDSEIVISTHKKDDQTKKDSEIVISTHKKDAQTHETE
jgi:hypothetical protein